MTDHTPVIKDRELLARVAAHNPHLAGTVLRLCNDLDDGVHLGELPPAPLLHELGVYLHELGLLVTAIADGMTCPRASDNATCVDGVVVQR